MNRGIWGVLGSAVLVAGLAGTCLAGATYRNDSGAVARAVRIEFSEPAEITSMWPSFPQRDPQGPATVIVLSGGEVPAGGWFSFTWRPDTARVVKIEWLAQTATSLSRIHERLWQPHFSPAIPPDQLFQGRESMPRWTVVYTEVFSEDFESSVTPTRARAGYMSYGSFVLSTGGTAILRNREQVLAGEASLRLSEWGAFETDPRVFILAPSTTYIVEFEYRDRVGDDGHSSALVFFVPVGSTDLSRSICLRKLLKNAPSEGTYSAGALTGSTSGYYLLIAAMSGASLTIDNLRVLRQDAVLLEDGPSAADSVARLPFPRLGNYLMGNRTDMAIAAFAEGSEFVFSVEEIERRASTFDILIGVDPSDQTMDPDSIRRLRALNPDILILPYQIAQEAGLLDRGAACGVSRGNVDISVEYHQGLAQDWIVRTISGDPVGDMDFPWLWKMNISIYCPVVGGRTFNDYFVEFVTDRIFGSGLWDGVYIDNLFDRINPHIPDWHNPSLLDFDINRNRLRDETPAMISEITRDAALAVLQRLRSVAGTSQLIISNTGPAPALSIASLVNGFLLEAWNVAWCYRCDGYPSEAGWKRAIDDYLYATRMTLSPRITVVQGQGVTGAVPSAGQGSFSVSDTDIHEHRFTLCSALLGDGFYEYDLLDGRSIPYWFDEYAVDERGIAGEDVQLKGYLGHPLGEAVELTLEGRVVWREGFEDWGFPASMWAHTGARVSRSSNEVISGQGSLILEEPDHMRSDYRAVGTVHPSVILRSGSTYVVEFDWKVLETLSGWASAGIRGLRGTARVPGDYMLPGLVEGDAGRARFPVTIPMGDDYMFMVMLSNGGRLAVDNIVISEGGAGLWRRDFENGFVLVNPLHQTFTLDLEILGGSLGRTGIRRILGEQAPDVNTGEPLTGSLVLGPFDAIILLADPLPRR